MKEDQEISNLLNKDGSGTAIFYKLQSITKQQIDELDYQQQIERWNGYQDLLDKIEKKCSRDSGVRLARNVKHNFRHFTDASSVAIGIVFVIGSLLLLAASLFDAIYLIGSFATMGLVAWQIFIRVYHPSTIQLKCLPVLHIDEFAYMRQAIKGIPPIVNDPVVRLPALEMSIPRAWLSQQGMLNFMRRLDDIEPDVIVKRDVQYERLNNVDTSS